MSEVERIVTQYTSAIDQTIQEVMAGSPEFIQGVIGYHLGWLDQNFEPAASERGKMVRPTISLLVYEALTGSYAAALPVAAAIEMIHNFSLLHDDIEDNDAERRGRPTAWTIWGKPLVINIGDHLYSLAYRSLYSLEANQFPPAKIFAVFRLINEACLALTAGQDLDLRFETLPAVETEMYIDMVYKKTGALLEAAILAGATLGASDETVIKNYHEFARNIGIAFQIRDDMLGIWGDTTKTGKSAAADLYRKKKTLPVIYTLNKASGHRRKQLESYYARPDPLTSEEVDFVRDSLEWAGAQTYTHQMTTAYQEKAFTALQRLDLTNQAQTDLETIAKFLGTRVK